MKVFIRVPNWVGDAVMAIPALRELRRIFTEARITLVARPWVAGLFDGEGLADDLIPVEDSRGLTQSIKQFFVLASRLRSERFDHAVLLQNAFGAALVARAAGAKDVTGYPTDGRRVMLHTTIPFQEDYKNRHQVFYYLNIAARLEEKLAGQTHIDLNNDLKSAEPRLSASEEAKEKMRQLLDECDIDKTFPHNRILAINPGATNSRAKQWLAERFAQAADLFAERDGFQTVIIGTAGDIPVAKEVASHMRTRAAILAGRTDIAELKAVLACSSLVLSNDTGAAHVSAALGVPTVVVFGPTEDFATRPFSPVAEVVRHQVECSPCMLRECPIDHRCMTRVEVNDVYLAARRLMAQAAE